MSRQGLAGGGTIPNGPYGFGAPMQFNQNSNTTGNAPVSTGDFGSHVRDQNGRVVTQNSKIEQMKPYFGMPKRVQEEDVYNSLDVENFDLPDAYAGKSTYLSYILVSNIITSNLWPVTKLLPWLKHDDSMEIVWDRWEFHDALLKRTPEESVSRLLTSTFGTHRAYIVRYGIALLLEHGFYLTEKGRLNYAMNLTQMRHAVVETSCFGAIMAVLMCEPFKDPNDKYRPASDRSMLILDDILRSETEMWACCQKLEDGFEIINDKLDGVLTERNQEVGNIVTVVPSGMAKHYKNRMANRIFAYSGIKAGEEPPSILNGSFGDIEESRGFKMGEHQPNEDPCFRDQTIGSFFQMTNVHLQDVEPHEFRTAMLDKVIYSENLDDWYRCEYKANARFLGLYDGWDTKKPWLSKIGKKFLGPYNTWGAVAKKAGVLDAQIKGILASKKEVYDEFERVFVQGKEPNNAKGVANKDPPPPRIHEGKNKKKAASSKPVEIKFKETDLERRSYGECSAGLQDSTLTLTPTGKQEFNSGVISILAQASTGHNGFSLSDSEYGRVMENTLGLWDIGDKLQPPIDKFSALAKPVRVQLTLNWVFSTVLFGVAGHVKDGTFREENVRAILFGSQIQIFIDRCNPSKDISVRDLLQHACTKLAKPNIFFKGAEEALSHSLIFSAIVAYAAESTNTTLPDAKNLVTDDADGVFTLGGKVLTKADNTKEILECLCRFDVLKKCCEHFQTIMSLDLDASGKATGSGFALDYSHWSEDAIQEVAKTKPTVIDESKALAKKLKDQLHEMETSEKRHAVRADGIVEETMVSQFGQIYKQVAQFMMVQNTLTPDQVKALVYVLQYFALHLKSINTKRKEELRDSIPDVMNLLFAALFRNPKLSTSVLWKSLHAFLTGAAAITKAQAEEWEKRHHDDLKAAAIAIGKDEDDRSKEIRDAISQGKSVRKVLVERGEYIPSTFYADHDTEQVLLRPIRDREAHYHFYKESTTTAVKDALLKEIIANDELFEIYKNARNQAQEPDLTKAINYIGDECKGVLDAYKDGRFSGDFYAACVVVTAAGALPLRPNEMASTSTAASMILHRMKDLTMAEKLKINSCIVKMGKLPSVHDEGILYTGAVAPASAAAAVPPSKPEDAPRMSYADIYKLLMETVSVQQNTWWMFCMDNNIISAIGWLGFKPHQRYLMGTMFKAVKGGSTGYTFHGHADFQLADNVAQKMHYGHFTINIKSLVLQNKNVVQGRNVYCKAYLGGAGHAIWDPCSNQDRQDYRSNELVKDIFLVAVLINYRQDNWHMDITGAYSTNLQVNSSCNEKTLYETAAMYSELWGWGNPTDPTIAGYYSYGVPKTNTIVFQEHESAWNHGLKKFAPYKINKGHWGDRVYPGCGQVRRGTAKYLRPCNYDGTSYFSIGT